MDLHRLVEKPAAEQGTKAGNFVAGAEDKYVRLLREVAERTGRLVAQWQTVGFVHGVLNTDNMSILGETIDYGSASHHAHCPFQHPEGHSQSVVPQTWHQA